MTDIHSPDFQDREAIAARAYEIWQRRGCPHGTAAQDWYEAEAELSSERRARLEATRMFEPPAPMELGSAALAPASGAAAHAGGAGVHASPANEAPAKRRRRAPANDAAANDGAPRVAAKISTGTRVTRKRPARPDA